MADWYGTARTNYVEVKDPDKFQEFADEHDLITFTKCTPDDKPDRVAFSFNTESGWIEPTEAQCGRLEADEDCDYINEFFMEAQDQLADKNVLVCMVVGNEKLRYVTGDSYAMDNTGKMCHVSLHDVHEKARSMFGDDAIITDCEY